VREGRREGESEGARARACEGQGQGTARMRNGTRGGVREGGQEGMRVASGTATAREGTRGGGQFMIEERSRDIRNVTFSISSNFSRISHLLPYMCIHRSDRCLLQALMLDEDSKWRLGAAPVLARKLAHAC